MRTFSFSINSQAISKEEGDALAKEYNIHFFETSAKQNLNVENAFLKIANDVKDRLGADGGPNNKNVVKVAPGGGSTAPKGGCC
jgi:Ras-related protein Rab-8A